MACEDRRGKIEAGLRRAAPEFSIGEIHEFEDDPVSNPRTGKRMMGGAFIRFERVHRMFGLWHREVMMCDATIKDPILLDDFLRTDLPNEWGKMIDQRYRRFN